MRGGSNLIQRSWIAGLQSEYLDEAERKLGKPGVIIDCDMVDPAYYSEAQIHTRLQRQIAQNLVNIG